MPEIEGGRAWPYLSDLEREGKKGGSCDGRVTRERMAMGDACLLLDGLQQVCSSSSRYVGLGVGMGSSRMGWVQSAAQHWLGSAGRWLIVQSPGRSGWLLF